MGDSLNLTDPFAFIVVGAWFVSLQWMLGDEGVRRVLRLLYFLAYSDNIIVNLSEESSSLSSMRDWIFVVLEYSS